MNPNHLTPIVRKQVTDAVKAVMELAKERRDKNIPTLFDKEEDVEIFFTPYYEKCKDEIDNNFNAFMELITLEKKYGFVGTYLGGSTLNPDGNTIIKIG